MTAEQEMKLLVEATGGTWYKPSACNCALVYIDPNPSPTDLNKLMEIAFILGYHVEADFSPRGFHQVSVHADGILSAEPQGQCLEESTPADALRRALVQAVKER